MNTTNDKITPAQYVALGNFTSNPYVSEWGGWYNAKHQLMGTDYTRGNTLRILNSCGYIERVNVDHHVYYAITPAGIAAHDVAASNRQYPWTGATDEDVAAVIIR